MDVPCGLLSSRMTACAISGSGSSSPSFISQVKQHPLVYTKAQWGYEQGAGWGEGIGPRPSFITLAMDHKL